ncbi:MAG: TerB family tellurite resistance protein [Rubrivivax sp.]
MLRTLKDLFGALTPPTRDQQASDAEHTLQLATAVMLMEVMRADAQISHAERLAVVDALRGSFALADDEITRLVELAEQAARDATDWFEFTSHINAHFDVPQKVRMVEYLWRVAYADGRLTAHERHVMWRISDLLHVPHGAYINAKMRAKLAAGVTEDGAAADPA